MPERRCAAATRSGSSSADARSLRGGSSPFSGAAPPEHAEPLYEAFCAALRALGVEVAQGRFGARMTVELVNDGPVTIVLGDA
jgi:D-tyrosyl-tRNA(Tyr) deacylase